MNNKTETQPDTNLISYCGFYCGFCPRYTKGECEGCKCGSPKFAVGYNACKVKPYCYDNGYNTCADCTRFAFVKDCKIYNPLMIRFGEFITRTKRAKGIEMIKEKGESEFVKFMADKKWVTYKKGKQ